MKTNKLFLNLKFYLDLRAASYIKTNLKSTPFSSDKINYVVYLSGLELKRLNAFLNDNHLGAVNAAEIEITSKCNPVCIPSDSSRSYSFPIVLSTISKKSIPVFDPMISSERGRI